MTKKQKTKGCFTVMVLLFLVISCLVLSAVAFEGKAFAATEEYLSPELYTADDHLLNPDGTLNREHTIVDFAEDVKTAHNNQVIEEITQVIPLEYLEWQEEYATLAYMGEQYGFYIYKYGENFYTLLIDFVYIDEPSNAQYTIRINPILQQCFRRAKEYGFYKWIKYDDARYKFYIHNPRFSAAVLNENALNYGDAGYSMQSDDGVIIRQSRVNYSGVLVPTSETRLEMVSNAMVHLGLGLASAVLDLLPVKLGTIMGLLNTVATVGADLYGAEVLQDISCNNEANLYTEMTKTAQLQEENLDSFSKSINISPANSNVLLSDSYDSFAELKVLLSDSNYRSRIIRKCEFDIGCKPDVLGGKYEQMTSEKDGNSFGFYDDRTIFDDENPSCNMYNNFDKSDVGIYLLPKGNQIINFTPTYSGNYRLQPPEGSILKLNGTQGSQFDLIAGRQYQFVLENLLQSTIIGNMPCTVQQYLQETTYRIPSNTTYIIGYQSDINEFKKIETTSANVKIGVLDDSMQTISSLQNGCAYSNFIAGRKYYFIINNAGVESCFVKIALNSPSIMILSQDYNLSVADRALTFINDNDTETCYKLQLNNADNTTVDIINVLGRELVTAIEHRGNNLVYTFALGTHEKCLITFSQPSEQAVAHLFVSPTQCRWRIDGQIVNGYNINLKPNSSCNISAEISSDGENYDQIDDFIVSASATEYSYANGIIRIGNMPNSTQITFVPVIAPDFLFTITVDDMITKIYLNHNGGTGYNGVISVELNSMLPSNLPKPTRKGYTFKGYYNIKQNASGDAKQYFTATMQGQRWDVDVDNATLYAHWERSVYTLTLDNGVGSQSRYFRYQLYYGDSMPTDRHFAPKKDGHHFLGYFSDPNSTAEQYYKVTDEMIDDKQSADIYGYSHYYVEGMEFCHSEKFWLRENSLTLYAHWEALYTSYNIEEIVEGVGVTTSQFISIAHGTTKTITPRRITQGEFKYFMLDDRVLEGNPINWTPSLTWNVITKEVVPTEKLVAIYTPKQCVAAGMLITLSNGSQVPVETLTGNETLLVWNMMTGQFDSSKIMFIDSDPTQIYKVINLGFSDGTIVKVISEHAFWDYNLNEYIYLREDASQYIGHWFSKQITNPDGSFSSVKVQLVNVSINEEYTTAYSPITCGHLCYYVNGMLSMPGGVTGFINIFDIDMETMTINKVAMEQDIEKYGLYTYEEFSALFSISEEVFNAFNGQYLKVAIGKGLIDIDGLCGLIERYSKFFA